MRSTEGEGDRVGTHRMAAQQSGGKRTGAGQGGAEQIGAGQSGTEQTGAGQGGAEQTGAGQGGAEQTGAGQSGTEQEAAQIGAHQIGTRQTACRPDHPLPRRCASRPLPLPRERCTVAAVIPTLNEAATIGAVIAALPRAIVRDIIVADSASRDGTADIARAAGARVVVLDERGYGRACAAGAAAADPACDIILFLDGDGADRADLADLLVAPIQQDGFDFVIGSRVRGEREPGSMNWHQVMAGRLAGWVISLLYGVRYTDMGAFRAIRRDALQRLALREATYGWNVEMQMLAARAQLRILEIPVPYRCRAGGASKVAGSLSGSLRAAWRIVLTVLRVAVARR